METSRARTIAQASLIAVLALGWHLLWVLRLPMSLPRFFTEFEERMSGGWASAFVLIPFFLFLAAMLFARHEKPFRDRHPLAFGLTVATALSPGLCAIIAFFLV